MIKPAPSLWRILKQGMNGHDVAAWQAALRGEAIPKNWMARWPLTVDGDFGVKTDLATREFQRRRAIPVNGVVDLTTRALIDTDCGLSYPKDVLIDLALQAGGSP